jgi:hypothetical protein
MRPSLIVLKSQLQQNKRLDVRSARSHDHCCEDSKPAERGHASVRSTRGRYSPSGSAVRETVPRAAHGTPPGTLRLLSATALMLMQSNAAAICPSSIAGRILVADDNPGVCRLLRRLLEPSGYEVEEVDTGDAALDRIGTDPPRSDSAGSEPARAGRLRSPRGDSGESDDPPASRRHAGRPG